MLLRYYCSVCVFNLSIVGVNALTKKRVKIVQVTSTYDMFYSYHSVIHLELLNLCSMYTLVRNQVFLTGNLCSLTQVITRDKYQQNYI